MSSDVACNISRKHPLSSEWKWIIMGAHKPTVEQTRQLLLLSTPNWKYGFYHYKNKGSAVTITNAIASIFANVFSGIFKATERLR